MEHLVHALQLHRDDVLEHMLAAVEHDEPISPGLIAMLADVERCLEALEAQTRAVQSSEQQLTETPPVTSR